MLRLHQRAARLSLRRLEGGDGPVRPLLLWAPFDAEALRCTGGMRAPPFWRKLFSQGAAAGLPLHQLERGVG